MWTLKKINELIYKTERKNKTKQKESHRLQKQTVTKREMCVWGDNKSLGLT